METYAITQASTGALLWTGAVDSEYAEQMAVRYAVAYGNVTLLSGDDVPEYLRSPAQIPDTCAMISPRAVKIPVTSPEPPAWTVTSGTIEMGNGQVRAAWRTDYRDSSRPSEYTVQIPARGKHLWRKATPKQAMTFAASASGHELTKARPGREMVAETCSALSLSCCAYL
jgi:hypothetical protein